MSKKHCHCETIDVMRGIIDEQDEQIRAMHEREAKRRDDQIDRAVDALVNALHMFPSRVEFTTISIGRDYQDPMVPWKHPDLRFANCTVNYAAPEEIAGAIRDALMRYARQVKP